MPSLISRSNVTAISSSFGSTSVAPMVGEVSTIHAGMDLAGFSTGTTAASGAALLTAAIGKNTTSKLAIARYHSTEA